VGQRRLRRHQILLAIGNPAVILAPSHKVRPGEMMVDTNLGEARTFSNANRWRARSS
jgi:hypothetical protein